jgi:hypothetical protein
LAKAITSEEVKALQRPITPQELQAKGVSSAAIEAWGKWQQASDWLWNKRAALLKSMGREGEIGEKVNNYFPERRTGDIQVPVYHKDGTLIGLYDFKKSEMENYESKISQDLLGRGHDLTDITIAPPESIKDRYFFPGDTKYYSVGASQKGAFMEKHGILGAAGTFGDIQGKELLEAMRNHISAMTKHMASLDISRRVNPMLVDPNVPRKQKDYVQREALLHGGNRSKTQGQAVDDFIDSTIGYENIQFANSLRHGVFIVGTAAKQLYQNAIQAPMTIPERGLLLKNQLGSEASVSKAAGGAMYRMLTKSWSPEDIELVKLLGDRGAMDQGATHVLADFTTDTKLDWRRWFGEKTQSVMDQVSRVEHYGRIVSALTFNDILKDVPGLSKQDRFETAINHTLRANVDYSSNGQVTAIKELPKTVGSMIGALKRYPLNDISCLITYAKSAFGAGGFKQDLAPLASYISSRLVLGGLSSAVAVKEYDSIANLWNYFFPESPMKTSRQYFADAPQILHQGIPTLGLAPLKEDAAQVSAFMATNGIPSALSGVDLSSAARPASLVDLVEMPIFPTYDWIKDSWKDVSKEVTEPSPVNLAKVTSHFIPQGGKQFSDMIVGELQRNDLAKQGITPRDAYIQNPGSNSGTIPTSVISLKSMLAGMPSRERVQAENWEAANKADVQQFNNGFNRLTTNIENAVRIEKLTGDTTQKERAVKELSLYVKKFNLPINPDEISKKIERDYIEKLTSQRERDFMSEKITPETVIRARREQAMKDR